MNPRDILGSGHQQGTGYGQGTSGMGTSSGYTQGTSGMGTSSGYGTGTGTSGMGTSGLGSSGVGNIGNPNLKAEPFVYKNVEDPAIRWNFQGVPGCSKCAGHGSYKSKLGLGKLKLCGKCMTAKGYCPRCNGSGFKNNDPNRPCRCGKKKVKTGGLTTGVPGTHSGM